MLKIESKVGKIPVSDEKAFHFLSDFNNFNYLIPEDKIKNWHSTGDTCQFTVDGIGNLGLKIIEKEPYTLIKISSDDQSKFSFFLWIQLKSVAELDTRIKLTIHADINPMLQMVAKKPLQKFVDMLVDQLVQHFQGENEKTDG